MTSTKNFGELFAPSFFTPKTKAVTLQVGAVVFGTLGFFSTMIFMPAINQFIDEHFISMSIPMQNGLLVMHLLLVTIISIAIRCYGFTIDPDEIRKLQVREKLVKLCNIIKHGEKFHLPDEVLVKARELYCKYSVAGISFDDLESQIDEIIAASTTMAEAFQHESNQQILQEIAHKFRLTTG